VYGCWLDGGDSGNRPRDGATLSGSESHRASTVVGWRHGLLLLSRQMILMVLMHEGRDRRRAKRWMRGISRRTSTLVIRWGCLLLLLRSSIGHGRLLRSEVVLLLLVEHGRRRGHCVLVLVLRVMRVMLRLL
jgi:hypothetical protein